MPTRTEEIRTVVMHSHHRKASMKMLLHNVGRSLINMKIPQNM